MPIGLSSHPPIYRREWPLAVHVEEALLTFEGDRGEMVLEQSGLRVHAFE